MNEEAAFIGAIISQPEEDTPRLVFADWLQEHGDEGRAEFIRVQCELARRGEWAVARKEIRSRVLMGQLTDGAAAILLATADTCPDELRRRERELWDAGMWKQFPLPWPDRYSTGRPHLTDIARGFLASVTCDADLWLAHGDAICERHPVTYVRFTSVPGFMFDRIVKLEGGRATVVKYNKWPRVEVELPQAAEITSEAVSGLMRTIPQQFVF